ncbi:MAG: hypothetical protein HZB26_14300 [Candidatus Hydrogenedentes bacterium]|nr:hypothetical protein [Candidatus Hydrogenedentota bacterium]
MRRTMVLLAASCLCFGDWGCTTGTSAPGAGTPSADRLFLQPLAMEAESYPLIFDHRSLMQGADLFPQLDPTGTAPEVTLPRDSSNYLRKRYPTAISNPHGQYTGRVIGRDFDSRQYPTPRILEKASHSR